jgi:superfamily II DNA or RNA helicase
MKLSHQLKGIQQLSVCKLIIKDEVNVKYEGLSVETRRKLANKFKYEVPWARYQPSYRLGRWDGTVAFFGIGGTGYMCHLEECVNIITNEGYEIEVEDLRIPIKLEFNQVTESYWADMGKTWPKGHPAEGQPIMLRDYQYDAVNKFLENPQCLQEIATGAGKTITTATLSHLCEKYGRTITIVPNKSLVEQTEEDFVNLGLDVGVYYGDRKDLNKTHTICTWQSLNVMDKKSKDNDDLMKLSEFFHDVVAIIVDEVHQAKADVLKNILTGDLANCPIRWGLTGTVPKEKFEFASIYASLGPVVNRISAHELQSKDVLAQCHVEVLQTIEIKEFRSYPEELKYLTTDVDRIDWMAKKIQDIAKSGNTLVLIDRIETGNMLSERIEGADFVSGAVKTKDRKETYDEIKTSSNNIIVATYGVAAVGINIPRIFNLVLVEPGKSFTRVIQSIGRGVRKAEDKDFVQIWDITGGTKYAKRHLTERKKFYKDAKYPFSITKVTI